MQNTEDEKSTELHERRGNISHLLNKKRTFPSTKDDDDVETISTCGLPRSSEIP